VYEKVLVSQSQQTYKPLKKTSRPNRAIIKIQKLIMTVLLKELAEKCQKHSHGSILLLLIARVVGGVGRRAKITDLKCGHEPAVIKSSCPECR